MILPIRKISFISILLFFYSAFIYLLYSSYELHAGTAEWIFPYETFAEVGVFFFTCIYLKSFSRWIYCLLAVLFFSVSAGFIHFYFSEKYADVDWQGVSGAINVATIQAIFSTYIFIFTAAFVWIVRFVMKKISIHKLGQR